MKVVKVTENLPLEDYLALEAETAKSVEEPIFFTWIVPPTVIYGRHQIRAQEVNESYCAGHGVRLCRPRQSDGELYLAFTPYPGSICGIYANAR